MTLQPVRLRMAAKDRLCVRSMEVSWEDGTGVRQSWSSWTDQVENGWYEAERLLPGSVTDIAVHFLVRGVGGPHNVCKVCRHAKKRSWVRDGANKRMLETIWLRRLGADNCAAPLDAVFQLAGPMLHCYIRNAWNSARVPEVPPADWEHWRNNSTKPKPRREAPTLTAANEASPPFAGLGEPVAYEANTRKRLCAGVNALLEIRGNTIRSLQKVDRRFTGAWWGVNSGNTVSAGFAIAAVPCIFLVPPVGVGLGVASGVSAVASGGGDVVAETKNLGALREEMSWDMWNTFVVADLVAEWVRARDHSREAREAVGVGISEFEHYQGVGVSGSRAVQAGSTVAKTIIELADSGVTSAAATESTVAARTVALTASRTLFVLSAVLSTGVAVHGWSTTKFGQRTLRDKLEILRHDMSQLQALLAVLNQLECPICLEDVAPSSIIRRCATGAHCFHKHCLDAYEMCEEERQRGGAAAAAPPRDEESARLTKPPVIEVLCPNCRGPLSSTDGEDVTIELIAAHAAAALAT